MKNLSVAIAIVVGVAAAVFGTAASALADAESYRPMGSEPRLYNINISQVTSSLDLSSPIGSVATVSTRAIATNRNPTIAVKAAGSGSSGDTMRIDLLLWFVDTSDAVDPWKIVAVQQATATTTVFVDDDGDNVAKVLIFDSMGARFYSIRHGAPSAGVWKIHHWAYGASSR